MWSELSVHAFSIQYKDDLTSSFYTRCQLNDLYFYTKSPHHIININTKLSVDKSVENPLLKSNYLNVFGYGVLNIYIQ